MRKPDFCLCENKDIDQLCSDCTADHVTAQLISTFVFATAAFVFATWIVQSLFSSPEPLGSQGELIGWP